jgi:hypothetical protein
MRQSDRGGLECAWRELTRWGTSVVPATCCALNAYRFLDCSWCDVKEELGLSALVLGA